MKKFLIVSLILIGVALITTVAVWYLLQGMFKEKATTNDSNVVTDIIKDKISGETETSSKAGNDKASSSAGALNLTPEQRQAAESIGLDPDALSITTEMIDCAAEKLSEQRIEEILAGAAPTVLETLSLIPCLKN